MCALITSSVHFVLLTVGRQPAVMRLPEMHVLLAFSWPSVIYALDILAWDWFYGLGLLFAAAVVAGGKVETALRLVVVASGMLSVAGLIFLPFDDINLRIIGIIGYAGLSPALYLLLALVFGRAASARSRRNVGTVSGTQRETQSRSPRMFEPDLNSVVRS